MKTFPIKATLKRNRGEETYGDMISLVNNNKSIYFRKEGVTDDYITSYSMSPGQSWTRIIEGKEIKPEHLFDFLTK